MAKKRQTIDSWIETVIADNVGGKACTAIALLHLKGIGGQGDEVVTRPIEGTVNIKEMADYFIGRAEGASQDLPGIQTFKVVAFYGSNEQRNAFHFTCNDGGLISRSEAALAIHEPTSQGQQGMLMKHNEMTTRALLDSVASRERAVQEREQMSNGILVMCLGPEGIVQRFLKSTLEFTEVMKDVQLDMFEKRRQLTIEEHKAASDLQMQRAVMDAIPHLVNRWTGREVFSEKDNKAAIIDKLAFKITPQDLELLVQMGKISKEEALVLSAQFAAIVEEKKKELEALRKVPSEEGQPKALANGHVVKGDSE